MVENESIWMNQLELLLISTPIRHLQIQANVLLHSGSRLLRQQAKNIHIHFNSANQSMQVLSFIPCYDCPAVKMTYSAEIMVPKWATARRCLMSLMSELMDGLLDKRFAF
jgi:hypothetical protein